MYDHVPLPCFCPAPCQSRSSDAPQTCPSPRRNQGPAAAPLAPWLSVYPATHTPSYYRFMRTAQCSYAIWQYNMTLYKFVYARAVLRHLWSMLEITKWTCFMAIFRDALIQHFLSRYSFQYLNSESLLMPNINPILNLPWGQGLKWICPVRKLHRPWF